MYILVLLFVQKVLVFFIDDISWRKDSCNIFHIKKEHIMSYILHEENLIASAIIYVHCTCSMVILW